MLYLVDIFTFSIRVFIQYKVCSRTRQTEISKIRNLTFSEDLFKEKKKRHKITKLPSILYSESKENDIKRYATGTLEVRFWSNLKKLHERVGKQSGNSGFWKHQCQNSEGIPSRFANAYGML